MIQELLSFSECLWVKLFNSPAPVKVGVTLKESGTYVDFANINSGGVKEDGTDAVNAVSYLILVSYLPYSQGLSKKQR